LGLNELAGQMVSLRKKFPDYKSFAGKPIEDILTKEQLKKATILKVHNLQSGYLKNTDGNYEFIAFKSALQVAPITAFLKHDFDADGNDDILLGGNYFGVTPFHGRLDSFPGALIKDENTVILANHLGLNFSTKAIRHLNIINHNNKPYLMATINNDSIQVYTFK